jgi:hypothetical protein
VAEGERYCASCGGGGGAASPALSIGVSGQVYRPEDQLEAHWYGIVWLSLLVPFVGGWAILILTTILYYRWRMDYPRKARKINVQGWLAFLASMTLTCLYFAFSFADSVG